MRPFWVPQILLDVLVQDGAGVVYEISGVQQFIFIGCSARMSLDYRARNDADIVLLCECLILLEILLPLITQFKESRRIRNPIGQADPKLEMKFLQYIISNASRSFNGEQSLTDTPVKQRVLHLERRQNE